MNQWRIPTHPQPQLRSVFHSPASFMACHDSTAPRSFYRCGRWLVRDTNNVGRGLGRGRIFDLLVGSRKLIPRAHRRGIRLSQTQQFEDAIRAHKESYEFFTRHSWLDRYRSITMMSPSSMSYREMALINIAFAYGQIGNGEKAKGILQRARERISGQRNGNCRA